MFKITMFSRSKPRQFDYTPRYYDPEKEAREMRRKELLGPDAIDINTGEAYKPGEFLRERMKYRRGIGSSVKANKKAKSSISPMRGLVIIILLVFAVLWALDIVHLPSFRR